MALRKCPLCNGTEKRSVREDAAHLNAVLDIRPEEDRGTCSLCKGRGYIDIIDGTIV